MDTQQLCSETLEENSEVSLITNNHTLPEDITKYSQEDIHNQNNQYNLNNNNQNN